ncbi:MAG TPA: pilus assembly protein PilP [Nitrospiraceae bacterium]|nr:pilus assembly protein PilP [Nitrospiraceae bacterium]
MNDTSVNRRLTMKATKVILIGLAGLFVAVDTGVAEPGVSSHLREISPMRQDSLKVPAFNDVPKHAPSPIQTAPVGDENAQPVATNPLMESENRRSYDPSGRRDPFAPVLQQLGLGPIDPTLPPLQRVGLTEMNLIAVIWGAYGYTAMVQTPDGNGYTVRRGTRIGPNNGVVSAVTEKGIVVQERFTDVYGSKQEREYVKLLHPKEGAE